MTAGARAPRRRPPSIESLAVATFALFGMGIGSQRIGDNSMFVHIRTGLDIVAGHGIPRVDPYSYTAHGHEWVVQSWLPSLTYGWLERMGGFGWVAAEQGVLVALLAWLVLKLARTGSLPRTIAAGGIAIGVSASFWSARPLLFGLIAFALTVLIVERRASPLWLVPVVWLWVNSHGSFPLGLLWLAAVAVGAAIDGRVLPKVELRYVAGFVAGLLASMANPLGPRLLLFPLTAGDKREIFETVVEWRSPNFQTRSGLVTLAFLGVGLLVLLRRRIEWRDALPVAGFIGLGLLAMRNLAPLGLVMAPVLRRSLSAAGAAESVRRGLNVVIAGAMAAVFVLLGVTAARGQGLETAAYPVAATTWLADNGYVGEAGGAGSRHVAHQDVVGCYLDLRFGRDARVFIDDRVDMFPIEVSKDYRALLTGRPGALRILDDRDVDAVLWKDDLALVAILQEADGWRRAFHHDGWSVFVRA